jgi:hypothetical protein
MSQQIQITPRLAQGNAVPKTHLPRLRAELEQQQRFRRDQIDELACAAALTADEARRQVISGADHGRRVGVGRHQLGPATAGPRHVRDL